MSISATGDDSNSGGPSAPVSSIERALARIEPGGTIEFAPGIYGPLTISGVAGLPDQPIRFVGGPGVEFRGASFSEDAGILISDSSNIEISGMAVTGSLWGIYVQNSFGVSIQGNTVFGIGQEAIRIKDGSSDIIIDNNRISDTGRRTDNGIPNGEGIYIGTQPI